MAAIRDPLPFDLGQTLKGTAADGTTLINNEVLGRTFVAPAYTSLTSSPRAPRRKYTSSDLNLKVVALRNNSGATLYGKRLACMSAVGGIASLTLVTGYANSLAQDNVVFIDPYLPSAGVADKDIFWGVYGGPVLHTSLHVGSELESVAISIGDKLVTSASGATSGTSLAGKLTGITYYVGATSGITQNANMVSRAVATALSAITSNNTDQDFLINLHITRLW